MVFKERVQISSILYRRRLCTRRIFSWSMTMVTDWSLLKVHQSGCLQCSSNVTALHTKPQFITHRWCLYCPLEEVRWRRSSPIGHISKWRWTTNRSGNELIAVVQSEYWRGPIESNVTYRLRSWPFALISWCSVAPYPQWQWKEWWWVIIYKGEMTSSCETFQERVSVNVGRSTIHTQGRRRLYLARFRSVANNGNSSYP